MAFESSTAQTSTLHLTMLLRFCSRMLHSLLCSSTISSTISTRPLAKVSRFRNPGYLSMRSISMAACCSGFTVSDSANRSRMV